MTELPAFKEPALPAEPAPPASWTEFLQLLRTDPESYRQFIPDRVQTIAHDPQHITIRPRVPASDQAIAFFVLETNYPDPLTDTAAWQQWQQEIAVRRGASRDKPFALDPPAPAGVNRLHARFENEIVAGYLQLSDRILMTCRLTVTSENPQALLVVDFDGETGQGIGTDFYTNTLPTFCKQLGLRFIVGQNNGLNISFFRDQLGRYTMQDIRPEYQEHFFPGHSNDPLVTIQFLYDEDVAKYIDPAAVHQKTV